MGNTNNAELKEEIFNREKHMSFGNDALLKQVYADRIDTALDMLQGLCSTYIKNDDGYIVYVGNSIIKVSQKEREDAIEYYSVVAVINTLLQNGFHDIKQVTSDHVEQVQTELTSYINQLEVAYKEMTQELAQNVTPVQNITPAQNITPVKNITPESYSDLKEKGVPNGLSTDYNQFATDNKNRAALAAGGYQ